MAQQAEALREAVANGEIGPLTDDQIAAEVSMLFAILDGLELQWLLDERVDLVGLFDQYLDQAIDRWRTGRASGPDAKQTDDDEPDDESEEVA